jgi:exodeoxyribonuclease-3
MKLVSWNVNGLRACVKKGFLEYFRQVDADIFCVQETKLQEGQMELVLEGYRQYWNYAERKGYSGTAVFTKFAPLSAGFGFSREEPDREGRLITLEFEKFYLVNAYTPNSRRDLSRLSYRLEWEDRIREYLVELDRRKPVVYCGDLNVAHREIDLKNAKSNVGNSGFTDEEREKMTELLDAGFIDSFRYFYRRLHLVVLPEQSQGTEYRLAHRLFPRVGTAEGGAGQSGNPFPCHGQRSLSRFAGIESIKEALHNGEDPVRRRERRRAAMRLSCYTP